MPNHVTNEIRCSEKVRAAILNAQGEVDFSIIAPLGTESPSPFFKDKEMENRYDIWGTKWNAYNQENDEERLRFQTAWCYPDQWLFSLAKMFPEEEIHYKFADEDTGSNCGSFVIKGNAVLDADIAPEWGEQTKEEHRKWRKFAFELCYPGDDPSEYYTADWDSKWEEGEA